MRVLRDFDLSGFNTMRLPAIAAAYIELNAIEQLPELVTIANQLELPIEVIGAGSNLLFQPYIKALVVRWSADASCQLINENNESCLVAVDAGYDWHQWVLASTQYGHGLENLALIPGTVGASPVQNIGAYGVEVGSFIEFVEGFDLARAEAVRFSQQDCQFRYRDSIFKSQMAKQVIITRVGFRLAKAFTPNLSYGPLQALADRPDLSAEHLINKISQIRRAKLPDPAEIANLGSFFKNPIIEQEHYQRIQQDHPDLPCYPVNEQWVKVPAAWLIEKCGWKGRRQGCVGMHHQQALVMTADKAQLQDVLSLQKNIEQSVLAGFDIQLEREPQLLG